MRYKSKHGREPRKLAEHLEQRLMFDVNVTAAVLQSPMFTPGNQWTYTLTSNGTTLGTLVRTVIGQTTFSGQTCWEADDTSPTQGGVSKYFYGLDASGNYVNYGGATNSSTGSTQTDVFTPPQLSLPSSMAANTPYSSSSVDATTSTDTSGTSTTSDTESEVITLASDSTTSLMVTAGTYDVYQITTATTTTDSQDNPTTDTSTVYASPQYGVIKIVDTGATYTLTNFVGNTDHLAFTTQPTDAGIAKVIQPAVSVSELNSSGGTDINATGSVTLTLTAVGTGTGQIAGKLNGSLASGVATFSDLTVGRAGKYVLNATDSTGRTTRSTSFDITAGKLVFKKSPTEGLAGAALGQPFIEVELEDAKGKIITDAPSNVTLSISGANATNPITGNTGPQANGIALFSNVKLAKPGTYTLLASDDQGDTVAYSNPIDIKGYHLAFRIVPARTGVNERIRYAAVLEDPKNRIVTADNTDGVTLSLNTVEGGTNAALSSVADTLIRGAAINDEKPYITINSPGIYTLNATLLDTSSNTAPTPYVGVTEDGLSKQFTIVADHLAFKPQPLNTFVNIALRYVVVLEDYQDHVVASTDQLNFALIPVTGGSGAALASSVDTLKDGMAENSGTIPLSINVGGTYQLMVIDVPASATDPVAMQVKSKVFKVTMPKS